MTLATAVPNPAAPGAPSCRFCAHPLTHTFCDLGMSPLSNSYVAPAQARAMEPFYPLHAWVCERCWLVQLESFESPQQIFGDYAYFSSYSDSWLAHARRYAEQMRERLRLDGTSQVVEIAANDGYLLQYFREAGVPVLGIEPAANVARAAQARGIDTRVAFFGAALGQALAGEGLAADLLIGNNVFAHVPDINDFAAGFAPALKPEGVLTLEFPHLLNLIAEHQFDTIYHEHFSYLSLATAMRVLERHGLRVFDIEQLPTHGGSLRVHACRVAASRWSERPAVAGVLGLERAAGLDRLSTYLGFAEAVKHTKREILAFLIEQKDAGRRICGYGAPAKGNTLLNYCGIGTDFIDFTVDRNPAKQGTLLPGSRIPVLAPEAIDAARPDLLLILPWNLRDEVIGQMKHIRGWGGRFIVPIPSIRVVD
jgi:2-polyprenyl-3-methyl-5-hydroxy-6-metoxy-1,4-benzoquinol methylase